MKGDRVLLTETHDGMVIVTINSKYLRLSYNSRRKHELSSDIPFCFKNMLDAINNLTEYLKDNK